MTTPTQTPPTLRRLWAALAAVDELGCRQEWTGGLADELAELPRPELLAFLSQISDTLGTVQVTIDDTLTAAAELHLQVDDHHRLVTTGCRLVEAQEALTAITRNHPTPLPQQRTGR